MHCEFGGPDNPRLRDQADPVVRLESVEAVLQRGIGRQVLFRKLLVDLAHHVKCVLIAAEPDVQTVLLHARRHLVVPPAGALAAQPPAQRVHRYIVLVLPSFMVSQREGGGDGSYSATKNRDLFLFAHAVSCPLRSSISGRTGIGAGPWPK